MNVIRINNYISSYSHQRFSTIPRYLLKNIGSSPSYVHYHGQRLPTNYLRNRSIIPTINYRLFHVSSICYEDESKVEKTVKILKKDQEQSTKKAQSQPAMSYELAKQLDLPTSNFTKPVEPNAEMFLPAKRKTLWGKIWSELKHYYNGFKLLFIETRIAFRLLKQVLSGHSLTRRERRQFTRTAADLFRLVPFSVFIVVPFMEFTLPLFLKFFPNMLPSTFKEKDKEQEKLKQQLKAKLEVAKFLQDTLEETALKTNKKQTDDAMTAQFGEFMEKIRSTGVQPSTDEIMKFSSLFEDELTLDNLDRPQLVALCKLLGISTLGPDYFLRFTLHMKLRNLEADDKLIQAEGVDSLDVDELQIACRERGMRSLGVSIERLQSQLKQWLDLHLNSRIPSTLLLLSRSLYLPETITPENVLKAAIQALPKTLDNATAVKIAEVSGERVDNTQRIEAIKQEEKAIRKEKEEKAKEKLKETTPAVPTEEEKKRKKLEEQVIVPTTPLDIPKEEILVDKAPILEDKAAKKDEGIDITQFETALEQLVKDKEKEVDVHVAEIKELKDDVKEYKDDVKEFETLAATKQLKHLTETRSAKHLSKRIDKLVTDLDGIVNTLDKKQDVLIKDIKSEEDTLKDEAALKTDLIQQHKDFLSQKKDKLVTTQELVNAIRQIQKMSSQASEAEMEDIIQQFDPDRDGYIQVDEILKALELIASEKVKISKQHLKEVIDLVRKEHIVEEKEKKDEAELKLKSITAANDKLSQKTNSISEQTTAAGTKK
ncbi:unnamed protein product [Didymodactylos carnosus]|uniref:Mitochondrial proton/calcium exchanger protein n=1 Tax=Didymodactylos carnosus TaxID=1234261 RepID=A0A814XX94_9BILA|nr:unnamed protein product [Didymodactylos carnosus]CAF1221496.1 unnamed protein product [Didymodactylos carnosus]CAF3566703.1 unnamed protein product [Didymodactylos carnosus]CAF3984779.1 unnamed protein product [Didymodactylos carnosus]